jgi:uncharacterized protein YkwD
MGTAVAQSHTSDRDFTHRLDRVGVRLTISLALMLLWAVSPAASTKRPGQPEIRVPDLERRVHELINKARLEHNVPALAYDERLAKIARGHSRDMVVRNFFSHVNPDGLDPTARGKLAGFTCRKPVSSRSFREGLGENLYQDNLYSRIRITGTERTYDWNTSEQIGANSLRGWMNSPAHRHNILEKAYSQTGIGIAIGDDDKVFITQLFC